MVSENHPSFFPYFPLPFLVDMATDEQRQRLARVEGCHLLRLDAPYNPLRVLCGGEVDSVAVVVANSGRH